MPTQGCWLESKLPTLLSLNPLVHCVPKGREHTPVGHHGPCAELCNHQQETGTWAKDSLDP